MHGNAEFQFKQIVRETACLTRDSVWHRSNPSHDELFPSELLVLALALAIIAEKAVAGG